MFIEQLKQYYNTDLRSNEIKYLDELYLKIKPFLDQNFQSSFQKNIFQRGWEIYIGNLLLSNGYNIIPTKGKGPDFCILKKNHKIWIECVFANDGSGLNQVPLFGTTTKIDDGHIPRILRITNSLNEKVKKFQAYKSCGIIGENDECYIAINSNFDDHSNGLIITGACYGRGLSKFTKGLDSELYGPYFEVRNKVTNKNNSTIITNILLNQELQIINGVIYNPNSFMQLIYNDLNLHINGHNKFYVLENPYTENTLTLINEIHLIYDSLSGNIKRN